MTKEITPDHTSGEPSFTDLLERDFRWPKIGDKLFSKGQPAYGAFVARHAGERLHHLTGGYKLAADLLIEQAQIEAYRRRKLAYPIVFCYRHFLELTLKAMLDEYGSLADITPNWTHHRLEDLWRNFRTLLSHVDADHPEEQGTQAVEQCIAELAKIDPISMAFRYPHNRKGQPFDIDHEFIDLQQLRDTMQAIENFFMGCDGTLGNLNYAQPDW